MRIIAYPADEGGCGYYRVAWPARAVGREYADWDVQVKLPSHDNVPKINAIMRDTHAGPRVVGVEPIPADVIILQRPLRAHLVDCIPFIQAQGTAVVVEVDDHFGAIDPRNVAWSHVQGEHRNHYQLLKACDTADVCTVTTPALAKVYGRRDNTIIIPNYVPDAYLQVRRLDNEVPVVGWSGTIDTHPNDLQQIGGAVAQLINDGLAKLRVVGTGVGVAERLGLPPATAFDVTGWLPIEEYPRMMAEIDIGLVPLDLTTFNECKSWLKGLEFAALGVPFVASPTGPYQSLAQMGIGKMAKPRKWGPLLRVALDYHRALGEQYRSKVAEHGLTINNQAAQWATAWEKAWTNRKMAR